MGKVCTTDVGTLIKLDTGEDITTASSHKIVAKPPDGGVAVDLVSAVVETTKLQHTKTALTLAKVGTWELQAYVVFGVAPNATNYSGEKVPLVVHAPIT